MKNNKSEGGRKKERQNIGLVHDYIHYYVISYKIMYIIKYIFICTCIQLEAHWTFDIFYVFIKKQEKWFYRTKCFSNRLHLHQRKCYIRGTTTRAISATPRDLPNQPQVDSLRYTTNDSNRQTIVAVAPLHLKKIVRSEAQSKLSK